MAELPQIRLPSYDVVGRLPSTQIDGGVLSDMAIKPLDLTGAVTYHTDGFPPGSLDYEAILPALDRAWVALARYDAKMSALVNSDLLLSPLGRQDAVSSSRMENTISTVEDLYRLEASADAGSQDPYKDVRNDDVETLLYSKAMRMAEVALQEGTPLSEHLIRSIHQVLLSHGRGARKNPGAYKSEQNYIADNRRVVRYIPIAPEHLGPAMQALTSFINGDSFRPLLRTAIAHVEFEALHPFEDGNGRIGRMLITLMLWKTGVLSKPHFFVSGYFEDHKDEYIDRMREVSASRDWTGWIVFFLTAICDQANANSATADAIERLYVEMRTQFRAVLKSQYHMEVLDFVFGSPVFYADRFVLRVDIPPTTARAQLRKLVEVGLLRTVEPASGRRAALYAFDPLLDLLKV
jgi:Fic family protein